MCQVQTGATGFIDWPCKENRASNILSTFGSLNMGLPPTGTVSDLRKGMVGSTTGTVSFHRKPSRILLSKMLSSNNELFRVRPVSVQANPSL